MRRRLRRRQCRRLSTSRRAVIDPCARVLARHRSADAVWSVGAIVAAATQVRKSARLLRRQSVHNVIVVIVVAVARSSSSVITASDNSGASVITAEAVDSDGTVHENQPNRHRIRVRPRACRRCCRRFALLVFPLMQYEYYSKLTPYEMADDDGFLMIHILCYVLTTYWFRFSSESYNYDDVQLLSQDSEAGGWFWSMREFCVLEFQSVVVY